MINRQKINYLKGKREFLERKGDERRLKHLDLEERDAWKDDITQPSNPKFKTLYPKQYAEIEKGVYQREQAKKDENKQRDALIHKFRHNSSEKQALIKLYGRE